MCITYKVDNGLYVNITNRCSNRCEFCIRNNGDGAYGSDSLWLEREPAVDEILESVLSHDLSEFSELVFCGYGEPTYRLPEAKSVALAVKQRYPDIKIRINTNGQSDLILGCDTAPMYADAFDAVSISLNTPSPARYAEICHSVYGERAYSAIIEFARKVKQFVPDTAFTVVRETLTESEISECERISEQCGVRLRIRGYIPPET